MPQERTAAEVQAEAGVSARIERPTSNGVGSYGGKQPAYRARFARRFEAPRPLVRRISR